MADVELMLREYGKRLDKLCPEVTPADVHDQLQTPPAQFGHAPAVEGQMIDPPQAGEVPAMDLLTGMDEGTENVTRNRVIGGILAIAAAIVLIVGGLLLVDDAEDEVETTPAAGATSIAPPTSSDPVFGTAQALSVVDAYFAANSAGDFAALQELFTPDAELSEAFIGHDEQVFAWNSAQGTTLGARTCTAAEPTVEDAVVVTCTLLSQDALVLAVDGPAVPIRLVLTVTPDGIREENSAFGNEATGVFSDPDFNAVGRPFEAWMNENHPEDADKIGFIEWASIEEAEAFGALKAQYAAEWAAYLEANGCGYDDGC